MIKVSQFGFLALAVWLIAGATFSSCQKSQPSADSTQQTTSQTTANQSPATSTTTNNYVTEYPVYKTTTEQELSANKDTISSVRERLKNANANLKAAIEREEQALERENTALQTQLESYKDQGHDAWMQFKSNFDRSMDSIRSNLRGLRERMSAIKQED